MQILKRDLKDWADELKFEIESDHKNNWFWPKSNQHQIFEQARMKFVNRNLNYFYFESMIAQVREGNEFNTNLQKTLNFCNFVRTLSKSHIKSPFGRMCVWKLEPGTNILPHKDNYKYHRFITRNIFIISDDDIVKEADVFINSEKVELSKGLLFQFKPDTELHSFHNKSDKPFYFLGFDFWESQLIDVLLTMIDYDKIVNDPIRTSGFGGPNTKFKYISKH